MLDKTTSILFSDLEKLFGSQFLTGEVTACKRITLQTEKGLLTLQIGDTEDHYQVHLDVNYGIRRPFLEELEEHNRTGRTCFCGDSKFCDC